MKKLNIIFAILILSLSACSLLPSPSQDPLNASEWKLRFIRKSTPLADTEITVTFEDGEVRGSSGCNSYFGEYEIKDNAITFGPIAMTEMACMEPQGVMEQEQEFLAFLSEVVSFEVEGNQLILKKAKQDQLTFEK